MIRRILVIMHHEILVSCFVWNFLGSKATAATTACVMTAREAVGNSGAVEDVAAAVDVELGRVDVVELLEVVDDRAASGTAEMVESPLLATNTSPFAES
jgi:hypothetical protein